jgi:peptidoglycan/xylan/chitin deacetylase (PgdA/CDA1 family)
MATAAREGIDIVKDTLGSARVAVASCLALDKVVAKRRLQLPVRIRLCLQRLWVMLLLISGSLWWAKTQLRRSGAVIVMTFHRVLGETDFGGPDRVPGIVVRERTFNRLAEYASKQYQVVNLKEVVPGTPSRKLRIAFTFDDGWSDNYTVALPIARAHGIPLTIFICPGLTGTNAPFWPDRVINILMTSRPSCKRSEVEAVIESLKRCSAEDRDQLIERLSAAGAREHHVKSYSGESVLSWAEIEAMDRVGVNFGSHTNTHQILTAVSTNMVRREVCESKKAIEAALRSQCDLFAYPNGDWSPEIRHVLADEGFKLAFTTERGAWTATCDHLAIPRANVYEGNLVGLRGHFSPAMLEYTTCWKVWRAMKRARLSTSSCGPGRAAVSTFQERVS